MNDLQRETLGCISRLADQMSFAAMQGRVELLKAQFDTMKKHIARLQMIKEATTHGKSV